MPSRSTLKRRPKQPPGRTLRRKPGATLADYPELVRQIDRSEHPRLDPTTVSRGTQQYLHWRCPQGPDHRWQARVLSRTQGSGCPFCAGQRASVTNSLAQRFPAVARQLHPSRNGKLRPSEIPAGSHRKLWWQCSRSRDHVWQASVVKRTSSGRGCPFCAGKRADASSSLGARHPELAREWHPTLNGSLTPHQVTPGSSRKIWWKCPRGADHVWQAKVANRTVLGRGCPVCSGQRTARSNSLAARHPSVAKRWFVTKNGELTPWDVPPFSKKLVWWRCPRGRDHRWQASVASMTRNRPTANGGCPFCRGLRVSVTNSLAALHPELAKEWHPRNGISPAEVVAGSSRRVWWKCPREPDHEWQTTVVSRAKSGHGCPFCSHRLASDAYCLAVIAPRLARQWHPTKNGTLTPHDVTPGSRTKVWWQCASGHSWRARASDRLTHKTGCPHCGPRKRKVVARNVVRERVRLPSDS